jgi:SOS-response transcriptional repressor LexA
MIDHLLEHHRIPTHQEIADKFEYSSVNSVCCHVAALDRKGYISRDVKGRIKLEKVKLEAISPPSDYHNESDIDLPTDEEFRKRYTP